MECQGQAHVNWCNQYIAVCLRHSHNYAGDLQTQALPNSVDLLDNHI